MSYANSCYSTGQAFVYAQPLAKNTKVFTSWDYTRYMSGQVGIILRHARMIIMMYILCADIFHQTYEVVSSRNNRSRKKEKFCFLVVNKMPPMIKNGRHLYYL